MLSIHARCHLFMFVAPTFVVRNNLSAMLFTLVTLQFASGKNGDIVRLRGA